MSDGNPGQFCDSERPGTIHERPDPIQKPKISARPNYSAMRDLLEDLGKKMALENGQEPTPDSMKEIRRISSQLVELALKRQQ